MILPIYAFGQPVLKKVASEIDPSYPDLDQLLSNMWETMYHAYGVGLAAPQIGRGIRLFIVDSIQVLEEEKPGTGIKQVFINPQMIKESGKDWSYEEGCLSIPNIRGEVVRKSDLVISFLDEKFQPHTKSFNGINARVIQHEYDHLEGLLFVEKLKPLKKQRIQKKLEEIRKGEVDADYKLKFV